MARKIIRRIRARHAASPLRRSSLSLNRPQTRRTRDDARHGVRASRQQKENDQRHLSPQRVVCRRLVRRPRRRSIAQPHDFERAGRSFPKIGRKCCCAAGSLSAPIRALAYGQDRRRRSRSVSLSWVGIRLVRACVLNPHGTKNIPPRARVRSYPVTEKHKAIWIWMGEHSPDHAKVPDFSVLDNVPEMHATKRDRITIRANYELIIDNLLDLSHTSYLHDGILGNADTVESEITVEQDGDDVVVGRSARNATAPGLFAILMPSTPERVDKFTRMRWMAPSNLRLLTGICTPGTVPESGTGYHAIH